MRRPMTLTVQALEARDVPAQFGIPWANPTALTVSFAPDGADVDGDPSELYALMARSGLSATAWQTQILRAFQVWTAGADLNVGLVADSAAALGASGYAQADPRFGDIRIFAVPLSASVLAITTPPGDLAGTRTGDIILNSHYHFGIGAGAERDLYTVLLQEAGHALGVANSPDPTSAMYEFYQGPRPGLSPADLTAVRDLYGGRPPTTWEPAGGNNTRGVATPLAGPGTRVTFGDLAAAADTDWYSFLAPADGTATVQLQVAGQSLLAARVSAYNAAGGRIATASATGPGQDLTLSLARLRPGAKYTVRVEEVPGTAFAAGQYQLRVADAPGDPETITLGGQAPGDDAGTNESFLSATRLGNVDPTGGTAYRAFATLRADDVDVYRVRAPYPGLNQANVMTATVRSFGPAAPQVTVTGPLGLPVAARVTANGNGLYTVVMENATANADYHLTVRGGAGAYELRAAFRSVVTAPHQVASGLLTVLTPKQTGTLQVSGSAQIYFRLSAALTPIVGPSVVVRVYDAANRVRFQLLARAGDTVDGVALLGPGRYRIEVSGNRVLGGLLPGLLSGFSLATALLTDPTGVMPADPNQPGSPPTNPPTSNPPPPSDPPPGTPPPTYPPPSGYNYYNDRGYYVWGEQTPTTTRPSG